MGNDREEAQVIGVRYQVIGECRIEYQVIESSRGVYCNLLQLYISWKTMVERNDVI